MNVREMQDQILTAVQREIAQLAQSRDQESRRIKAGTKAVYREAQAIKWQARRIARMAYAIEVLESIEPRYGNWAE